MNDKFRTAEEMRRIAKEQTKMSYAEYCKWLDSQAKKSPKPKRPTK